MKEKMTFRSQLIFFGFFLVSLVAVPVLVIETRRPWQVLDELITQAQIVIMQTKTNFWANDLRQLNQFALEINSLTEPDQEDYLAWTFGLKMLGQELPSETVLQQVLQTQGVEVENFDYAQMVAADFFWEEAFAHYPQVEVLLLEYKRILLQAKQASLEAGFEYDDLYIMTDNGEILVFLLDGGSWWETSYPGLEYDVIANDCPDFRNYLQTGPGFDSDPRHYHYGIFPKFNSDKWGTWFSVWYAEEHSGIYNNVAIDFKANRVKNLMWAIGLTVFTAAVIILLIILLITSQLSQRLADPISNLIVGISAVAQGDFSVSVLKSGSREFGKLIDFFNQMVGGLKERLNMKQTLEKILSPELAEQVAKEGLVLGGQKVNVSVLFTDFVGFSAFSRHLEPEEVLQMLNDYWLELIPIIRKWGGFPDKYIGDAILVIFGAPVKLENHALNAVACAIEIQRAMRRINQQRMAKGQLVFEMRIGLNSGEVIAGAIGSDLKMEYTTIGETTNLSQRMEANCQPGHILIAQGTFEQVHGIFFDGVDFDQAAQSITVKGYDTPVQAYNIFASNLQIGKNEALAGQSGFYQYDEVNHHLKFADQMSPEQLSRFTKIVRFVD